MLLQQKDFTNWCRYCIVPTNERLVTITFDLVIKNSYSDIDSHLAREQVFFKINKDKDKSSDFFVNFQQSLFAGYTLVNTYFIFHYIVHGDMCHFLNKDSVLICLFRDHIYICIKFFMLIPKNVSYLVPRDSKQPVLGRVHRH